MARKRGERVLGPYGNRGGRRWQVVRVAPDGTRTPHYFPTKAEAAAYCELYRQDIASEALTVGGTLDEYERYLREVKGNKPTSVSQTLWAVRKVLHAGANLSFLSEKSIRKAYETLVRSGANTATHRGCLAQTKTFLNWCVKRGYLGRNPAAEVEGVGRRSRGKKQLTVAEARKWYQQALFRAHWGSDGAVGALMSLLLGLRASEIVAVRVGDIDCDQVLGDLVHVRNAKTAAGDRTLEVPSDLQPLLAARAKDREVTAFLFPTKTGAGHWRDWVRKNVRKICTEADVPEVTAHGMRGLLATLALERGTAAHAVQATLGHEDVRTTKGAYAAPGSAQRGERSKGLVVMKGGKE